MNIRTLVLSIFLGLLMVSFQNCGKKSSDQPGVEELLGTEAGQDSGASGDSDEFADVEGSDGDDSDGEESSEASSSQSNACSTIKERGYKVPDSIRKDKELRRILFQVKFRRSGAKEKLAEYVESKPEIADDVDEMLEMMKLARECFQQKMKDRIARMRSGDSDNSVQRARKRWQRRSKRRNRN